MLAAQAVVTFAGAALTVWGAVDAYQGRMREDPRNPGLYIPPRSGPRGLVITLCGAALTIVGGALILFG